jgi:hypothetical protein
VCAANKSLSINAAAMRLGVSRWQVWQMIADGRLDVEPSSRGGRVVTRVCLPDLDPLRADEPLPKSQTERLQEQVDKLSHTVQYLSALLTELAQECVTLRENARREPAAPRRQAERPAIPHGITARPNPMTHPAAALGFSAVPSREQALAPIEALLQDRARRAGWWPRQRRVG